ncbi:MAG: F0F1 ATP synthase subunit delta [Gammaproteobacteria bacterium]
MQATSRIPKLYARAVVQAAAQEAGVDAPADSDRLAQCQQGWVAALGVLVEAFQSPVWRQYLSAPGYTRSQRAETLLALIGDTLPAGQLQQRVASLTHLLCHYRRLADVDAMMQALQQELDIARHMRSVQVTSARPLQAAEKKQIENRLPNLFGEGGVWNLQVAYSQDAALLEGVRVQCGDLVVDASLAGGISQLKAHMGEL